MNEKLKETENLNRLIALLKNDGVEKIDAPQLLKDWRFWQDDELTILFYKEKIKNSND